MVALYVFAMVRTGAWEIVLNQAAAVQTTTGKPLAGNHLTAHTLGFVKWNTQLDKALLGARVVVSTQKGWNEILPFARVLDDSLKPAASPDEEQQRNEQLLVILSKLKAEIPQVESICSALASELGADLPKAISELCAHLAGIATTSSYQEFDAAVRESYADKNAFDTAFGHYVNARSLRDISLGLKQARDYLNEACNIGPELEARRVKLIGDLTFNNLLASPDLASSWPKAVDEWKADYVQGYRQQHRQHFEDIEGLAADAMAMRPRLNALARLNTITELGPVHPGTGNMAVRFESIQKSLDVCSAAAEADVQGNNAICPRCRWTPQTSVPTKEIADIKALVGAGLTDRMQRLRDGVVAAAIAAANKSPTSPELRALVEIVESASPEKLADAASDDLISALRQILREANIVQESISLGPILKQVGAIEAERVDEAMSLFARLVKEAIGRARAKHGAEKRVRVFLRDERE